MNQSVLDLAASMVVMLRHIYVTMDMTFDNPTWRKMYCMVWLSNMAQILLFAGSGYNLVALSVERYFAIMNPFEYDESRVMTIKQVYINVSICIKVISGVGMGEGYLRYDTRWGG